MYIFELNPSKYESTKDILPHDLSIVDAWGFVNLVEEYSQILGRVVSDNKTSISQSKLCIHGNPFDIFCNMLLRSFTYVPIPIHVVWVLRLWVEYEGLPTLVGVKSEKKPKGLSSQTILKPQKRNKIIFELNQMNMSPLRIATGRLRHGHDRGMAWY